MELFGNMGKHGNFSLGIEIPQQLSNDAYHHSDRASEHVSPGLVTLLPAPCGTQNQGQDPQTTSPAVAHVGPSLSRPHLLPGGASVLSRFLLVNCSWWCVFD